MFRGFRYIAIAIGLIFFGPLVLAQESQEPALESQPIAEPRQEDSTSTGQRSSSNEPDNSVSYVPVLKGIESAIRDLIAEEDKIERERQKNQKVRDLHAQEEMALWAKYMSWATTATVFLTFIALVAIIRTLHHTRRAGDAAFDMVEEAKSTTKAAQDTINVMRDEQRPWVVIVPNEIVEITQDGDSCSTKFSICCRNVGKTPAIDVVFRHEVILQNISNLNAISDSFCTTFRDSDIAKIVGRVLPSDGKDEIFEANSGCIVGEDYNTLGWVIFGVTYRRPGSKYKYISHSISSLADIVVVGQIDYKLLGVKSMIE